MNREILFRGKRTDGGDWVHGTYHHSADNKHHYILQREAFLDTTPEFLKLYAYEVHEVGPETVGQYIGLTDKAGIKIFEGDLLEYDDSMRSCDENGGDFFPIRNWGIVEWVFNYCGWSVTRRETVEMDEFDFSACEVIGNRIDDHELIKTE